MTDETEKAPAYSWYALGVLFLVYLFNFVDRQILSILANDIKADLGLDDAQLGFLYGTAFAIFYALFGIPLGRLADNWSRTKLLALGLTLWSSMTALSGFAKNLGVLTVARIGVGVGEASSAPVGYSLVSDYFPARMRGTAQGIFSAGLFTGSGLSLLIGGLIVAEWNRRFPGGGPLGLKGWQAAFVIVGLPGLLLALWVLTLREPQRGLRDGAPSEGAGRPFARFFDDVTQLVPPFTLIGAARAGSPALLRNLAVAAGLALLAWVLSRATGNNQQFWFWVTGLYAVASWAAHLRRTDTEAFGLTFGSPAFMGIVVTYGTICFLGYVVSYWAAPYAERTFALSKPELGVLIGAPNALGGFLGVIMGGRLADYLHQRTKAGRPLVFLVALLGSIPVFLLAYTTTDLNTFLVCNFLSQFVTSSALGAGAAATQSLVLPRMRGVATAIYLLGATLIGLSLGPFTAGFISERTGSLGAGVLASLAIIPLGLAALAVTARTMSAALARLPVRAT
ncbi:spinster family MFS transporter [Tsuneonella sp. HG222]